MCRCRCIDAVDEDDGYLVSFRIDENRQTSECIPIDCKDFAAGPVVRIALPHKICSSTHTAWADRRFIENGYLPRGYSPAPEREDNRDR